MSFDEVVLRELAAQEDATTAVELWPEIWAAFEVGGPDAVKALIQEKVRAAKKRGAQQIREMRSAAAISPPKRPRRLRVVTRGR